MKRSFAFFLFAHALCSNFICAQTATDLNEGSQLTHDSVSDTWTFSWWGRSGITYFIQQSDNLTSWQYIPVIEPGQDGIVEWNFATSADKLFMRLKYTDIATADPFGDDFDGDSISNINELMSPPGLSLDPFDPDSNEDEVLDGLEDTDGDFMLNGEELANGLNPLVNDAMSDLDGDGYPNIYELRNSGGNPNDKLVTPTPTYTVATDGSGDYDTLQDSIDAVTADYSIILVKAGSYTGAGNPDFVINGNDPKMLLISQEGADTTMLDGENARRGGRINNSRSALAGFTVSNCSGVSEGGGLYVNGDEALIYNCTIRNNKTTDNGGGIYVSGNSVLLKDCAVYENIISGAGGGIYINGNNTHLENCYIDGNKATGRGGGIYVFENGASSVIESCQIRYNKSGSDAGGIRLYNVSDVHVHNTIIHRNKAALNGGAVNFLGVSNVQLLHTTIHNNKAVSSGNELYKNGGSAADVTLTNCIVWNDDETDVLNGSTLSAGYSIIKGITGYQDNGNVSNADPQLTFRSLLTFDSTEAVDKGTDAEAVTDIHGEARPTGIASDIGADEWIDSDVDSLPDWLEALGATDPSDDEDGDNLSNLDEYKAGTDVFDPDSDGDELPDGEEFISGLDPLVNDSMLDADGDGYPNIYEVRNGSNLDDDLSIPAATQTVAADGSSNYATLQSAIDAVANDYSIVLVKAGAYTGSGNTDFVINSDDPAMLVVSETGAATTVIDGEGTNKGGRIDNDRSALVGFSIRNCISVEHGGGIHVTGNNISLLNCEIYDNKAELSGGGIFIEGINNYVLGCNIYKNEANSNHGGGIYTRGDASAIDACRIYNNTSGNRAGGLRFFNVTGGRVLNTLIYSNHASSEGGGVNLYEVADVEFIHATLLNNTAPAGNEIYQDDVSVNVVLTNSIVWNQGSDTNVISGSSVSAGYSIIRGTSGYQDNGNVSNADPQLNSGGTLTAGSSTAIDQGVSNETLDDIHGKSRPQGSGYDIGADEWVDSDNDGLPDWLEDKGIVDASGDADTDNLLNLDEYNLSTGILDPDSDNDGVIDGDEVSIHQTDPLDPDTDGDELLDGEELANGLNPLVNDTMLDLDGDGYPNIYELRNSGGNPNDKLVTPTPTYTVATDGSGDHATLQNSINAVETDYSIILVKAGGYTGAGNPDFVINGSDPQMLLISQEGADTTMLDGENARRGGRINNSRSALVGFTVSNCSGVSEGGGLYVSGSEALIYSCTIRNNKTTDNGGGIYINGSNTRLESCDIDGNKATGKGGGIYVFDNGESSFIESCQIHHNESGSDAGGIRLYNVSGLHIQNSLIYSNKAALSGGAINFLGVSNIQLLHTTMHNNKAVNSGNELYKNGGSAADVTLTNCIVWNDDETNVLSGDTLGAGYSIIRGTSGYVDNGNVSNADPHLTFRGLLTSDSVEAIDKGNAAEVVPDIHGEARPTGIASDIGADEWIDSDADSLPDWLEALGATDPSGDEDVDNLSNLDEYKAGTDAFDPDSDGDGLRDDDEILVAGTDPLKSDTELLDTDLNSDGIDDSVGLSMGIHFYETDNDGDGVSNDDERSLGTNLHEADSDGDGESDATDPFPLDASLDSSDFANNPADSTAPTFLMTKPVEAIEI